MGVKDISGIKGSLKNSFRNIKKDMDELRSQIDSNNKQIEELKEMISPLIQNPPKREDRLKQDMMSKVKRNRKGIIKARILELVETERYSTPEIKDMIVNRDRYCSKATFYRYINELKNSIEEVKIGSRTVVVPIKTEI